MESYERRKKLNAKRVRRCRKGKEVLNAKYHGDSTSGNEVTDEYVHTAASTHSSSFTDHHDLTNEIEDSGQNSCSTVTVDDEDDFYSPDEEDFEDIFDVEEEMEEETDVEKLRRWAIECSIPQSHLDKLLAALKNRIPELPKSSKTLLKSCYTTYKIQTLGDGEFVYIGILKGLLACVNNELHEDKIFLQFNIDGIPLYKSSATQFWPILCKVHHPLDIYEPFVVAIYTGKHKPQDQLLYFKEFVNELNSFQNGVEINDKFFEIDIKCFVCDTPARAFAKCTKNHGGYAACERCYVHGERYNGRTIYPDRYCVQRTDESFRNQIDKHHHVGESPLRRIELPFNFVDHFLLDFMHLACLGTMKKLLTYWLTDLRYKISYVQKTLLSKRLEDFRHQICQEFPRTPRSALYFTTWKATEYRFFLLYCGPIVMKSILNRDQYLHFLLFHTACRILSDKELALTKNAQAENFLQKFFDLSIVVYKKDFYTINGHNLVHLAQDVRNMNCHISLVTAFPFENLLGKIKTLLRSGNRPLAQVCRRLQEISTLKTRKAILPKKVTIIKKKYVQNDGEIQILKMKFKGFLLTPLYPNNNVMLMNGKFFSIQKMFMLQNDPSNIKITGIVLKKKCPMFTYPLSSKHLNMWEMHNDHYPEIKVFPLEHIQQKLVTLSIKRGTGRAFFSMPLLH